MSCINQHSYIMCHFSSRVHLFKLDIFSVDFLWKKVGFSIWQSFNLSPSVMVHKISVTIRAQIADPPHPNTSTHLKYSLKVLYFVETSGASICINMIIPPVNTLSVKLKKPYTKPLPSKIKVKLMPSSKFVYLGTILILYLILFFMFIFFYLCYIQ